MSYDYSSNKLYPAIKNLTASPTWTDIVLPPKGKVITVGSESHDLYVSFEGTEGGGTAGVNKLFIKGGGYMAINMGRGTNQHNKIQIATKSSSSAEVTVILEEQ